MSIKEEINTYIKQEQKALEGIDTTEINEAIMILQRAIIDQRTIYCFGNGGSASTASHFANDFNKILNSKLNKKFNFVCLNDNIATIMAIANDISYDEVFRFQLKDRVNQGDIVIAISGSGNSTNVIKAVQYAQDHNAFVIGLTGFDGGILNMLADIKLHVPINNMQITEDAHLMLNHLLVSILSKFTE